MKINDSKGIQNTNIKVSRLALEGLLLIEPKTFRDPRGFFLERFSERTFREAGLPTEFVQDNYSRSLAKTLRGLHCQFDRPQSKLVTCLAGRIFDVVVDVRAKSKTFGQSFSMEMAGDHPQWLWVPAGFAHGFCVLGNEPADVLYKVDSFYNAAGERALLWNDSELKIKWPIQDPILSEKDRISPPFADYKKNPCF